MKKVLGIIGSPRKLGNSEIMVKEISRHIPVPHELTLVRLNDFDIRPCRACYQCLFKEERCIINDDFNILLEAIKNADALILAAPTYLLGANASLKQFIDRGLAFYAHIDRLWGKPSVGVCIAGIEGMEGHGLLDVENFLKIILSEVKMTRVIYGALPGEIFLNKRNQKTAEKLGSVLFQPFKMSEGCRCPFCGGDTFRYLGKMKVRCMLCSSEGRMDVSSGQPSFIMDKSEHNVFLSKEDALRHKQWLIGMKARFLRQKAELKQITANYRKEVVWLYK